MTNPYDDFSPNDANFVPLSPISFLTRAATVYGSNEAVVYGDLRRTWKDVYARCRAVASEITKRGLGINDTVSVLAPNVFENFELHYAIPMSGAVINTINTRLEAQSIAYILEHGETKLVFCDEALWPKLEEAFEILGKSIPTVYIGNGDIGDENYEDLVEAGDPNFEYSLPKDEWQALSLNYTSGTSGLPKGVVYHHRGSYLMSLSTIAAWSIPQKPVFMSVSPMFHCNAWSHLWAMTIVGAKLVFTRDPDPKLIYEAIARENVTHFGGAPIVLSMLCESEFAPTNAYDPAIKVMTAGAPPPPAILEKCAQIGFDVMQVYGLTETYGHISQCLWRDEWYDLEPSERASMQAKQGIAFPATQEFTVLNRETLKPVPMDNETQGEIAVRANTVMKGYFKNPEATKESFSDGYFWSGDVAVMDEHGYVQIRDRLKDVIISGGENISSVEVEAALFQHPLVINAAVVAMPSEKWGESPCAFIELREGAKVSADEIIAFSREHLAGFKAPKAVYFEELPKTSTGKIKKFLLRERAKNMS